MKIYIGGGKGIEKPIDFNGEPIQQGDILTSNFIGTEYENEKSRTTPVFIVLKKVTDAKTYFFGLGLKRPSFFFSGRLYAHDFTFKETIRLGNIKDMPDVLEPISDDELSRFKFQDGNITPCLYKFDK